MTDRDSLTDLDSDVRERLDEFSPSCKHVYATLLAADGAMTRKQIEYEALLAETTTKRALRQLYDADLITCTPRPSNPNASEWWVVQKGAD